jgi:hypothetical protein
MKRIFHFDIKTIRNYGDTLLFEAVRHVFHGYNNREDFYVAETANLREVVGPRLVERINSDFDAVLVGGGGLFLSDTNPNSNSGWQWNISLAMLKRIRVPIIIFAVGNNRFIGQEDFGELFREHLSVVVDKSIFVGLRNTGSVKSISEYLPSSLRDKVRFQPCPTTLLNYLFPREVNRATAPTRSLSMQALIGKRQIKSGFDKDNIYLECSHALLEAKSVGWNVSTFSNAKGDDVFCEYASINSGAPIDRLYGCSDLLEPARYFKDKSLIVGMRGHAQMIPFGWGTPIISLFVHDKLRYFLDDIGHPELMVDCREKGLRGLIFERIKYVDEHYGEIKQDFLRAQKSLFDITMGNLSEISKLLGGGGYKGFEPYSDYEIMLNNGLYISELKNDSLKEKLRICKDNADKVGCN